jgi:hypothetical protein
VNSLFWTCAQVQHRFGEDGAGMSEPDEEQQTAAQPPIVPDERHGDTPQSGAERRGLSGAAGWRERAYGIKGVAAVAVAGLIIGGGAGAAIHAATADDGGRDGRPGFGRDGGRGDGFGGPGGSGGQLPGHRGGPGQGQWPQPPGGRPAQPPGIPQQPANPPDDSVTPDSSGDTTSGDDT